jgi:predicted ArsR family transcriptional regulator
MPQRLLNAIAPGTRLRIMNALKRTQGLTVRELAERLGMSYMGVKDVSAELHRRGLLETWREPRAAKAAGRPQMVYRLTERAHELFPVASNPLTHELLEAARKLHGATAPEKLLHMAWQQKATALKERVRGETLEERAESLARVRETEGHMATLEDGGKIVEHHCPYLDVLRAYPLIAKLEADLFTRVLGAPVKREEECAGGLYRAVFSWEADSGAK